MKTNQKPKAIHKWKSNTRKVCCTLLASCIFFSSCGKNAGSPKQDLTQCITTAMPQNTLSPVMTPTDTPIPTSMPTPEATPTPNFTFLPQPSEPNKTSLLDYMSQKKIDAAFSLSYDPDSEMQLYARYQGKFQSTHRNYCIDFIQVEDVISDILINIKIYSGSVRYLKYGNSYILQNMYYYIDTSPQLDVSEQILQIMDINNDGYDDFVLDLGLSGNKNKLSIAFVYDTENNAYTLLGHFYTATYIPEGQTICEQNNGAMGYPSHDCKYFVVGTKAVLTESIDSLDSSYTYKKLMDGEFVTVLEDATYKELCEVIVDFDTWYNTPAFPE